MKSTVISSLVILAASMLSTNAMALMIGVDKGVTIEYDGEDPVDVGTLHCEFPQYFEDDQDGFRTEWCQYLCKWINAADLPKTTTLYLWERMTSGKYDCEDNAKKSFTTNISINPDRVSKGFSFNQDLQKMVTLSGGQSPQGVIYASVVFEGFNYTAYGLTITDQ